MIGEIEYLNNDFNNLLYKLYKGSFIRLFNNKIIIAYDKIRDGLVMFKNIYNIRDGLVFKDIYNVNKIVNDNNLLLTDNDYLIKYILQKNFLNDSNNSFINKYIKKFILNRLFKTLEKTTNINNVKMVFKKLELLECNYCNSIYNKFDILNDYKKIDFFSQIVKKNSKYDYFILKNTVICNYCFLYKRHDELLDNINSILNDNYCLN
jgi:hypothetical protein